MESKMIDASESKVITVKISIVNILDSVAEITFRLVRLNHFRLIGQKHFN